MDKTIKIWDLNKFNCIQTINGHSDCVNCFQAISSNLWSILVSGSSDTTIRIWNLNSFTLVETLNGHKDWVTCLQIISSDTLASGSKDKSIRIWNLKSFSCVKIVVGQNPKSLVLISPNLLASGGRDGSIKIWNTSDYSCFKTLSKEHTTSIRSLILIPPNLLVSGSADNNIKIWNLKDFCCIKTIAEHSHWVNSLVSFSSVSKQDSLIKSIFGSKTKTSNFFISASSDYSIKIWNTNDFKLVRNLSGHSDWVNCLQIINSQ